MSDSTANLDKSSALQEARALKVTWFLFFFYFASIGIYFPFLNIYLRGKGFSGGEIGLLGMAVALASVAGSTIWGYLNDRTGRPRLLMVLGSVFAALVLQLFPLVDSFWSSVALASLAGLINAGVMPLINSITLALLGERGEDYGRYRLGGTFGFILTSMAGGALFEALGLQWMFLSYAVVIAGFALAVLGMPAISYADILNSQRKGVQVAVETGKQTGLQQMFRQPAWIITMVCVFLIWLAANSGNSFLSVALKSLGGSDSLVGIAAAAPAVAEIPFMFYSGQWIRRFGEVRLMWLSMFMYIVRFITLGISPTAEWMAGFNGLGGPCFVFFWNSSVNYVKKMSPPGYASTSQGLLASISSLGAVVSSVMSGYLFDWFGGAGLYFTMTGFCGLAAVIFGLGIVQNKLPKV